MKVSYVISIILSIITFLILSMGFSLNVIFSLVIAIISYFAYTLILKSKEELQIELDNASPEYIKLTKVGKDNIEKIRKYKNLIENTSISDNIDSICNTSDEIIETVRKNPKKITQIRRFIDYYLPFTVDILEQYNTIEDRKLTSTKSKDFMKKTEELISRVNEACDEQLNNLYEGEIINTNASIKVFEDMLKSDGLVDDDMKIKVDRK